jgi:hypothetical protein
LRRDHPSVLAGEGLEDGGGVADGEGVADGGGGEVDLDLDDVDESLSGFFLGGPVTLGDVGFGDGLQLDILARATRLDSCNC